MYSDENKASSLAKLLIGFDLVMLDTCSLMEDSFPEWLDVLKEAKDYLDPGFTLVVPKACSTELKKHSISRDVEKRITSKRALKILKKARHDRLVSIGKKNYNQNFADNAIYSQASQDRLNLKILVITQDKKLATDLKNLNKLNSQRGRPISVYKVVPGGKLEYNQGETFQKSNWKEEKHLSIRKPFKNSDSNGKNDVKENVELSPEAKAIQGDKRLNANLKNPNYSLAEKVSDIQKQLDLLSGLPENKLKAMHLLQGPKKLKESLAMLQGKKAEKTPSTPSEKKEPAPAPEPAKLAAPQPVKTEPVVEAKKEPSILVKTPAKKLWYGEGNSIRFALGMVAEHYGLMFRDPSIPYLSLVHGPLDLTSNDENQIVEKLSKAFSSSPKAEFDYSTFRVSGEKDNKGYKVYLDLHPVTSVQPETEEKAKKAELSKETKVILKPETSQPSKPEKPAKEDKKPAKTEEKPTAPVNAVPNSSAAVPGGVTLVIGVPADERKRGYIERSAKRAASKEDVKSKQKEEKKQSPSSKKKAEPAATKKAEKPAPKKKKEEASSKPKTQAKPKTSEKPKEAKTKQEPKKVPVKVEAKKEPAKEKKAAKKASPQKKDAPKQKAPEVSLEAARKGEKILKANIHNPNYSSSSKKKDLENQLALVKKLSKEDQAKLSLSADALKGMLYLI